jgi:hypothetical protein
MATRTGERIIRLQGGQTEGGGGGRGKVKFAPEVEGILLTGGSRPSDLVERISFEEGLGGCVQRIALDGKPLWVRLENLEGLGRYDSRGKDQGEMTFRVTRETAELLTGIEDTVCRRFAELRGGGPVGTLYMSESTLNQIFKHRVKHGDQFAAIVSGPVEMYDATGTKLSGDVSQLSFDSWRCNVIVQPCWLYVATEGSSVHWRLRQMRFVSHPTRDEVGCRISADSDCSL